MTLVGQQPYKAANYVVFVILVIVVINVTLEHEYAAFIDVMVFLFVFKSVRNRLKRF